jgi:ribosomal protein S27AE
MTNADWWAKQLGAQPAAPQARPADIPMPPSQQPMARFAPTPMREEQTKAQSAKQTQTCPECGSGNYMAPAQNVGLRCYDCGYPLQQYGSKYGSLTGARVEGDVKTSRGNDVQSNWNPQGIIGRIDG